MNATALATTGLLAAELAKPQTRPTILDLPDGLHTSVPGSQYYVPVLGVASQSGLKYLERAPAVYWAACHGTDVDEDKLALRRGTALHCALLEPDVYLDTYATEPDFGYVVRHDASGTTKAQAADNKQRRDDWRRANADKDWLEADLAKSVMGMREAVLANPDARRIIERAQSELTAKWTDTATSIVCKGRVDLWSDYLGDIADIKSAVDATPDGFQRAIAKYRYHRQGPMYRRGLRAAGADPRRFTYIVVEPVPPYLCACYRATPESEAVGNDELDLLLRKLADCCAYDVWPGLPPGVTDMGLPGYYQAYGGRRHGW